MLRHNTSTTVLPPGETRATAKLALRDSGLKERDRHILVQVLDQAPSFTITVKWIKATCGIAKKAWLSSAQRLIKLGILDQPSPLRLEDGSHRHHLGFDFHVVFDLARSRASCPQPEQKGAHHACARVTGSSGACHVMDAQGAHQNLKGEPKKTTTEPAARPATPGGGEEESQDSQTAATREKVAELAQRLAHVAAPGSLQRFSKLAGRASLEQLEILDELMRHPSPGTRCVVGLAIDLAGQASRGELRHRRSVAVPAPAVWRPEKIAPATRAVQVEHLARLAALRQRFKT